MPKMNSNLIQSLLVPSFRKKKKTYKLENYESEMSAIIIIQCAKF